jgi:outer membrane lipoprotein-sorting protein
VKTKFLFAIVVLLSVVGVQAMAQKKAEELLREVIDKTRAFRSMEVYFTYRMVNDDAAIDEIKEGKIFIKGEAYKLIVAGQSVMSDGKTVWTYLADSDEVMISDAEEGEDAVTPGKLLTTYYNDFKASYVNDKSNMARGLKTVELKPLKKGKFAKIHIGIDERKLQIVNFSMFEGNNVFTYNIDKLISNGTVDDKHFTFKASDYPSAEIIDMR